MSLFAPPPPPGDRPYAAAGGAAAEQTSRTLVRGLRRLRRRYTLWLLSGYLLLSAVVATAAPGLRSRTAGHLSVALILFLLQFSLTGWALAAHRREAKRLDVAVDRFREGLWARASGDVS